MTKVEQKRAREKLKVGRPKLHKRNDLVCRLRIKEKLSVKVIAEMLQSTEDNIFHILNRHLPDYLKNN